jgi:predicted nucleic acid-binding Zn ribbon protein
MTGSDWLILGQITGRTRRVIKPASFQFPNHRRAYSLPPGGLVINFLIIRAAAAMATIPTTANVIEKFILAPLIE